MKDSSLEFFKELVTYRGRIVSNGSGKPALADEVALISRLLFNQFLWAAGLLVEPTARDLCDHPHPDVGPFSNLSDLDRTLALPFQSNARRVNQESLLELIKVLPNYNWSVTQNGGSSTYDSGSQVQPWILDYIYQRWINNRETGSYFTPDFLAYSIVTHAFSEWARINSDKIVGDSERLMSAMRCFYAGDLVQACDFSSEFDWISSILPHLRIVDLSVGGGAFLVAATRFIFELTVFAQSALGKHLTPQERVSLLRRIYASNIHGLDIMEEALTVAKMRLWLLAIDLSALDFESPTPLLPLAHIIHGNSLADFSTQLPVAQTAYGPDAAARYDDDRVPIFLTAQGGFDLCVGNPPFIALSQGNHVAGKAEFIKGWNKQHPEFEVRPTSDLSNFFILRGLETLKDNGVLAYITSRNFFDTQYGAPIRRFLTKPVELRHLFTLHEHPFVQQGLKVKANTVILSVARRSPTAPIKFHHLISPAQSLVDVAGRVVSREELGRSANWTQTLFENPLRQELTSRCDKKLADFARAKMGTKTGCNTFFLIRPDSLPVGLKLPPGVSAKVVKNSREIAGYVLPFAPPYRILNLASKVEHIERGYVDVSKLDSLARYIYQRGVMYACSECQSLAEEEHRKRPEAYPYPGMCQKCSTCQPEGAPCDRPVDRLSTQGHHPEWYTLALRNPPTIAVQCIVDTEIGVFWNQHGVFVTDQFQAIDSCLDEETAIFLFLFLTSRISHYLLEGMGLHRARYDGSFMLKIQVSHLSELPSPDLRKSTPQQKQELIRLYHALVEVPDRKSDHAKSLRDEIDRVFLELLGYRGAQIELTQASLRTALEQAVLFRWTKSNARNNAENSEPEET